MALLDRLYKINRQIDEFSDGMLASKLQKALGTLCYHSLVFKTHPDLILVGNKRQEVRLINLMKNMFNGECTVSGNLYQGSADHTESLQTYNQNLALENGQSLVKFTLQQSIGSQIRNLMTIYHRLFISSSKLLNAKFEKINYIMSRSKSRRIRNAHQEQGYVTEQKYAYIFTACHDILVGARIGKIK